MANISNTAQREHNRDLCNALMGKQDKKVIQVCQALPEGPLQRVCANNDTVLHMAARSEQSDLVPELLELLPGDRSHRLVDIKNNAGDTILHEVATSDNMIGGLLFEKNYSGEMPIFCAARYGQILMFIFLADKMKLKKRSSEEGKPHLQRNDRTTVLHISIVTECFENDTSWELEATTTVPNCNSAPNLVERQNSQESSTSEPKKSDETPLFLATISNNPEIVKAILAFHPHALENTNKKGRNILHEAILYRQIDIFDLVLEYEMFAKRLLTATDNEGNSLLHMVGKKRKSQASEKMQSPALQLRNEMLLFEKVKSASRMHFSKALNRMNQTAEELFAATNDQLHREAKEWLMRTTENCTIVAVFIATVAFAAAYTVPGGPDQSTGIPILNCQSFFVLFILADVISLTLALTSVGIFLSILTSSFPLRDFKAYLFKKLIQGIICLILSVSMMAVAFGATIILIMAHNWENALWHVVAFLPVPIFFLSFSPLRSAFLGTCRELLKKLGLLVLVIFLALPIFLLWEAVKGLFKTLAWGCASIDKSVRWIFRNRSQPTSDTHSLQLAGGHRSEV
ncbi:hypothetical protein PVL29_021467 [Vitis rotundifolia]|uniref:PGG domain-containing protein n=1 Tax=Vitis rotundifolia TaxID=103349 RepID=A0AA39DD07_VITRO|nr:hypothetical protein PVL29_021467 [Vitis rotundifolia]